jgi:hypothetical protein
MMEPSFTADDVLREAERVARELVVARKHEAVMEADRPKTIPEAIQLGLVHLEVSHLLRETRLLTAFFQRMTADSA